MLLESLLVVDLLYESNSFLHFLIDATVAAVHAALYVQYRWLFQRQSVSSQLHVSFSFQLGRRSVRNLWSPKITPQPGVKLLGLRCLFRVNLSSLCCASVSLCHFTSPAACRMVYSVTRTWPFCWAPGTWGIWGSEGSSLSPSGCRFWLWPGWNRTCWDAPCSPLWGLWSHGQDLPKKEQKRGDYQNFRVR